MWRKTRNTVFLKDISTTRVIIYTWLNTVGDSDSRETNNLIIKLLFRRKCRTLLWPYTNSVQEFHNNNTNGIFKDSYVIFMQHKICFIVSRTCECPAFYQKQARNNYILVYLMLCKFSKNRFLYNNMQDIFYICNWQFVLKQISALLIFVFIM